MFVILRYLTKYQLYIHTSTEGEWYKYVTSPQEATSVIMKAYKNSFHIN